MRNIQTGEEAEASHPAPTPGWTQIQLADRLHFVSPAGELYSNDHAAFC
ncbi:MAG: hypothetical protein IPI28_00225 [Candidatus Omnitrophica bacterium]|nr:hypothetical protein [Candidatus Omnitrophota bacterium]